MEPYETLEQELANWLGYRPDQVVVCSSGTAALHLALEAFQLRPGCEVVVPDYTMIACARAVTLAGLRPVFVDCDERLCIDADLVPKLNLTHVKALMAVHIYGRQCDMDRLAGIANWAKFKVIEDMAEAHGVPIHPKTDAAVMSFYKNKIVHGEEGGAVFFKETYHADHARCLRSLGFTAAHDFLHLPRGHNYRLANLLAEPIRKSLRQYPANARARREIEEKYDAVCPVLWRMPPRDAVWVYDLRIPGMESEVQYEMVRELQGSGIEARHGFKRITSQLEYRIPGLGFTKAALASQEVVYLPVVPGVTGEREVAVAFEVIERVAERAGLR